MPQKSPIEWTDWTSNPLRAYRRGDRKAGWHCVKVSPGCQNCYAEKINMRLGTGLPFDKSSEPFIEILINRDELTALQKLNEQLAKRGTSERVFVHDMTDVFGQFVSDTQLDELFDGFEACANLTIQVLTKRPHRAARYLVQRWSNGTPPNIHIGASVEDQQRADERIPHLLKIPAGVLFLSVEPIIGPIQFTRLHQHCPTHDFEGGFCSSACPDARFVDWVIVGGESGQGCRETNLDWIHAITEQCGAADVPCFVKQLGAKPYYLENDTKKLFEIRDSKGGDQRDFPCHFRRVLPNGIEA